MLVANTVAVFVTGVLLRADWGATRREATAAVGGGAAVAVSLLPAINAWHGGHQSDRARVAVQSSSGSSTRMDVLAPTDSGH